MGLTTPKLLATALGVALFWGACLFVCMYIYVRKKFRIVNCGFITYDCTVDCVLFEFIISIHSAVSLYPIAGESI